MTGLRSQSLHTTARKRLMANRARFTRYKCTRPFEPPTGSKRSETRVGHENLSKKQGDQTLVEGREVAQWIQEDCKSGHVIMKELFQCKLLNVKQKTA